MELILKPKEFKHISKDSSYNHNFYEYIGMNHVNNKTILEICHEDYDFYEYFLIRGNENIFLGCCNDSIQSELDEIRIDFQLFYS